MALPKPANPVLNPNQTFAQGLLLCIPFSEGSGAPVMLGSSVPVVSTTFDGATPWTSNSAGFAWLADTSAQVRIAAAAAGSAQMTVAMVMRARAATLGRVVALLNGDLFAYVPFSDSKVYWDYGGTSAPNRLSVAGLTFSQTVPATWVFTGGAAGSTIWQNGIKVGSQATALTRNSGGADTFVLNADGGHFDFNYLALYNVQWDDATAAAWSADPYAMLYGASHRSAFGAQKPNRRRMHV